MNFDTTRLALVDTVGSNILIRGPEPLVGDDKHFALDQISNTLKIDLTEYYIQDICLIDNQGEAWAFYPELTAFSVPSTVYPSTYWPPYLQASWNPPKRLGQSIKSQGKPQRGSLTWWPIEGFPQGESPKVYLGHPGWDFAGVVDYLIGLSKNAEKTAIYFHCMVGADRTGSLHAGYLMKERDASVSGAITVASTCTSAGAPAGNYLNLIRAYGASLGKKK
jgi:hypothetical protein